MPKTDVKLYTTDAGTGAKQTTTVSYVNPSASYTALKTFAQQLNNLTTNTYTSSDRIETLNLDTEEQPAAGKKVRTVTISNPRSGQDTDITISHGETETLSPVFTYEGGGTIYRWTVTSGANTGEYTASIPSEAIKVHVGVAETEEYNSSFTITGTR